MCIRDRERGEDRVESRDWLGRSDWQIQQNAVAAVADRRRRRRRRCAAYQVAPASDKKARSCLWREAALMAVVGICSYISMHTTSHAGDASVDENL